MRCKLKSILTLTVLLLCLSGSVTPQNKISKLRDPFLKKYQFNNDIQLRRTHTGREWLQKLKEGPVLAKTNKSSQSNSVIFMPVTITTDDTLREKYTYDKSGNILTELEENFNAGVWVNCRRYTCTYDNFNNCLSELSEDWKNGAWVNTKRYLYTYDESGNILTNTYEDWIDGKWESTEKYTYTYSYDNSGYSRTGLYSKWIDGAWVISRRFTYVYNNAGNHVSELYEKYEDGAWINLSRYSYTCSNSGKELTELYEQWAENSWQTMYNLSYTYDNSDREISELYEYPIDSTQVTSMRLTFTYDNSGNLLTRFYDMKDNSSDWINYGRISYTYNGSGNCLSEIIENWADSAWVNAGKYTFTYDNNGNAVHGESFTWQNNSWVAYPGTLELYYNNNTEYSFCFGSVVDVEYTAINLTGIDPGVLHTGSFNLAQNYPNPFNPVTVISYQIKASLNPSQGGTLTHVTLKVFDVLGKEVAVLVNEEKTAGKYEVMFNAANLSSGMYFYQLNAGDFVQVKKMMLLR
jgi:hypothetical protein